MHPPRTTFRPLEIDQRVGDYRVVGPPMCGGFAAVYRCVSEVDGHTAAVKVLHESHLARASAVRRFEHEVEAIRRIAHPNIVEVFTQGVLADGRPYYVMEWLDGQSLEDELRARGPLLPADALPIVEEIAAALSAAHVVGVVHRDLKPENIMAVPKKDWLSIKLLDFGIAKLIGASDPRYGLTTTGTSLGTVYYMAPEQILCDAIDARTDVYALGVLVYRMVTGELPFSAGGRIRVQMAHLDQPAPVASERAPAAEPWDGAIRRCMSKAPSERPQSIDEALLALREALSPRPAEPAAGEPISLQIELGGNASTQPAWNARSYALVRASAWIRAAGWDVAVESDNALIARAALDPDPATAAAQEAVLFGAARRVVETFRSGTILWALPEPGDGDPDPASDTPARFVARAWIRARDTAHPLSTPAAELPAGLYVARSLAAGGRHRVAPDSPPELVDFVRLEI